MSFLRNLGEFTNKALQKGANVAQRLEASHQGVPKQDIPYTILQAALKARKPEEIAQAHAVIAEQAHIRPGVLNDLQIFLETVYETKGRVRKAE